MIPRRSFLQGVFGGVTSAGLIIAGSKDSLQAFTAEKGAPVVLAQPEYSQMVTPGEQVYNAQGQVIGVVEGVSFQRNKIEVTTFNDAASQYVLGIPSVDIRVRGLLYDHWGKPVVCTYCGTPRPFNRPCLQCGAGKL